MTEFEMDVITPVENKVATYQNGPVEISCILIYEITAAAITLMAFIWVLSNHVSTLFMGPVGTHITISPHLRCSTLWPGFVTLLTVIFSHNFRF